MFYQNQLTGNPCSNTSEDLSPLYPTRLFKSMCATFKCMLCPPGFSVLQGAFPGSKCCAGRQLKILSTPDETSDYNDSNLDEEEEGEAMDDFDFTKDDDDSCYEDDDCNSNVENDDGDFDGKLTTDSEEEDENYDSGQGKEPVSNDIMREYD